MIYVALLRGINVGGKNKVDMKMLKLTFENAGMTDVVTYINTGNIIFSHHNLSKAELAHVLEEVIYKDFELHIRVVIRSIDEIRQIMDAVPDTWQNDKHMKSDVLFLWEDIDDESVLENLVIKPDIDTVTYVPGAVLWSVAKKDVTKSGLSRIVGTKLYKQMTVRNVNTARKIYELMQTAPR
ncbi:uncharacterized protein (DUF1697 family) [Sinobaca qinghaiensis]|uniref:Uncharacterized protein (DUF1697 family) n=1 Tax=Sinobaca qinghaiensis TaxID=342944 RepID=A0A419V8B0_9BACL|nr:DUF1697 domain-containing protein [Sinobaca qinghaiensis]RKD76270.1 uncharacterized protein (DUF1697 family) [Sinobaca qinghaiensis]